MGSTMAGDAWVGVSSSARLSAPYRSSAGTGEIMLGCSHTGEGGGSRGIRHPDCTYRLIV